MSWYVFIYDHTVLKGDEETDPDPFEAIRLFYPPSTSVQRQHELCSQLMGVCKFMDQLLKCKPKVFHLGLDEEQIKVACIHCRCGQFTFAYGSSNLSVSGDCVHRHAAIMYDLIVCYYGCLSCLFSKEAPADRSIDLVSSIARFQTSVTFSDKTLPAIFQPIPQRSIVDSFAYQHVTVFLENLSGYEHVMGGCIIHNKALIASQLPLKIASKFLLIKSYYIESTTSDDPSKKLPDFLKSAVCQIPLNHNNAMVLKCHFTENEFHEMKKSGLNTDYSSRDNVHFGKSDNNAKAVDSGSVNYLTKSCCANDGYQTHFVFILSHISTNLLLLVVLNQSVGKYYDSNDKFSKFIDELTLFVSPTFARIDRMLQSSKSHNQHLEMDSTIPSDALVFDYVDQSLTVNNLKDKNRSLSEDRGGFTVLSYSQMQLDEAVGDLHDKLLADQSLESVAVVSKDIGCLRVRRKDGNKEIYEVIDDKS